MDSRIENKEIVITLSGRIDTNNAGQVEKEVLDIIAENTTLTPAFDASDLAYISSAGLRVLMKVSKMAGKKVKIYNVSKEIYEIFETTGFTNILDVQKALRQISVEGCELIGSGGFGKVYRTDPETIVKVYTANFSLEAIQQERDTAQKAFLMGVPTAISYDVVKCDESYGVVYELLNAKTTAQIMNAEPERIPEIGKKSANLLKQLHQISVDEGALPDRKKDLIEWVDKILPVIEPSEAEEIRTFIKNIPDSRHFLHGDFNSKNIMVNGDEFLLIDIGDAAFGHPVFDVAGLVLAYVYLINSQMPDEEKYRLLGFHLEDAPLLLNQMIASYFGIDENDKAEIGKRIQMLIPYSNLLSSYHGTRRCGFNLEYMQKISQMMIKTKLLPSIREAKSLEW
ncbi:MAG: phosphotransferase [Treponema sp.]|nr:phosphotransferase [Treponema sp.]